jgi:hypothetical protein
MVKRCLQSAGGAGGTLFSALMLVIIVICFVSAKSYDVAYTSIH